MSDDTKCLIIWFTGLIGMVLGFIISWKAALIVLIACTCDNVVNRIQIKSEIEKEFNATMKTYLKR